MRITIDNIAKTIEIEDKVNLKNLIDYLNKILDTNEFNQYSLIKNTTIKPTSFPLTYGISDPYRQRTYYK